MTAWFAIVILLCGITKCCADVVALEYGKKFVFATDEHLFLLFFLLCLGALVVDVINFARSR